MSQVIRIQPANALRVPTLVLIDLQQEYIASPRALALPEAAESLQNCRKLLAHARSIGLPIAFMRRISTTPFFNPATRFSQWIEGFEPINTDMIFDRGKPSCYSNESFMEVIDNSGGHLVIAGFAGESACLSTAIEAFHRGHQLLFLPDASASHSLEGLTEREVHRAVTSVISLYAAVSTTKAWIATTRIALKDAVLL